MRGMARDEWRRITDKKCKYGRFARGDFSGYAGVIEIISISEPFFRRSVGKLKCLADAGYAWVQLSPDSGEWWLTAMLDPRGEIIQYYFDITLKNFVSPTGEPRFIDLYLDIVSDPDGNWELLDRDELDAALNAGDITAETHALAMARYEKLIKRIEGNEFYWRMLVTRAYNEMKP